MLKYIKRSKERTIAEDFELRKTVAEIISHVRTTGDNALREYSRHFDGCHRPSFKVKREEIEAAYAAMTPRELSDLREAKANIEAFAAVQKAALSPVHDFSPKQGEFKMNTDNRNLTLKRSFGMKEAVTITVGTVIGVGLFTTGAQIVGMMGSKVILATLIAMIISVYPARLYGEMGAALPYAGGTYKYAQLGLGKAVGMLAGWNFIITNIRGTEMTDRLQNGFMFFFWGVALIWFAAMIPNISLPSYVVLPETVENMSSWGFIGCVAMIWWCFAGFETCCALGISLGGDFSTLNASIAVPPRYLYAMAREGAMPKVFAKLSEKYRTPYVSILFLGVLSLILVAYPINFVASVSLFADLFYYIIGIAAALGLRCRCPDLARPCRAPFVEIGVPISIIIYFIMLTQLDRYAIVTGIIWCIAGLAVFFICQKLYGPGESEKLDDYIMQAETPSSEEASRMDKEYRLWKLIVAAVCIVAALLYAAPLL